MATRETYPKVPVMDVSKQDHVEEIEKANATHDGKPTVDPFTPEEERGLVRKLDFW